MIGKEKYFQVLGIHPTNDLNAIKKAYRKQALKFHPDRNPSPDAHIKFILITEAYEVLTGQRKVRASKTKTYRPKTKEEILAEKMARARERWKKQQEEEERKDKEYYRRVAFGWKWKVFGLGAIYTAIFSTLLICDYFMDGEEQSVSEFEILNDMLARSIKTRGETFHVDSRDYWFNPSGFPPVRANYSYLFHDFKSVSVMLTPLPPNNQGYHSNRMRKYTHFEGKELYNTYSQSSIYGVFPYVHIMFFVPLALVIFRRPNLRFSIWRLVSIWIIYPTIIFFSFSNDRIFNLLELILE